jgi:hypothetical protein
MISINPAGGVRLSHFTSTREMGHTHELSLSDAELRDALPRSRTFRTSPGGRDGHVHQVTVPPWATKEIRRGADVAVLTSWHVDHNHAFGLHGAKDLYAPNPIYGLPTGVVLGGAALLGLGLYFALRPSAVASGAGVSGKVLATTLEPGADGSGCLSPKEVADVLQFITKNSLAVARALAPGEPPSTDGQLASYGLTSVSDPNPNKIDSTANDTLYLPSKGVYPKGRLAEAITTAKSVPGAVILSSGYRSAPCAAPGVPGSRAVTGVIWVKYDGGRVFAPPPGLDVA